VCVCVHACTHRCAERGHRKEMQIVYENQVMKTSNLTLVHKVTPYFLMKIKVEESIQYSDFSHLLTGVL
jgi:hypothetical protein